MSTIEKNNKHICDHCALKSLCIPANVSVAEQVLIDQLLKKHENLKRGEYLQQEGDVFSQVYVVKSGAFKAENKDGSDVSISGFYLPGEFMGLDAIANKQYLSSFKALESSSVCVLSYDDLLSLMQQIPTLQEHFIQIMSRAISLRSAKLLQHHTAQERLMLFFKRLSDYNIGRGFSGSEFTLPMSRKDIANYLDLATETISRLFAQLVEQKVIEVDHKRVVLLAG